MMQYHRGLLHQRGHGGWGGLAKVVAKVAAPIVGQVVSGLIGGNSQTGQGIGGMFDFMFNAGKKIAEWSTGQKLPISSKGGKIEIDHQYINNLENKHKQSGKGGLAVWRDLGPQSGRGWQDSLIKGLTRGVGFTGVNIIPQSGRGVRRVKRKKQKGKGFITDLLKTGA